MNTQLSLLVNGEEYTPQNFTRLRGKGGIFADLANFLADWYSPEATMRMRTSGSTGKPQEIVVKKSDMLASARLSCRVFGFNSRQTALLCLPLQYIAGKMMVVRAMESGMNLLVQEPNSTPLKDLTKPIDFAPLVPMQIIKTMEMEDGEAQLARVKTILVGGAFLAAEQEEALQRHPGEVYASYGMTETLSHVALRRINGPEASAWYSPLPGVSVEVDEDGILIVSAFHLSIAELETNDIAEVRKDGTFRILGRKDAVINCGAIKIQAEEMEHGVLEDTGIQTVIVGVPHKHLGECPALLWEGDESREEALRAYVAALPKQMRPHHMLQAPGPLPKTINGKVARAECRELALQLIKLQKSNLKQRLIRSIKDLENSKWWKSANDPKVQNTVCDTASLLLGKIGGNHPVAKQVRTAIALFKNSKTRQSLLSPRNIIILTAALLYTVAPLDAIPDLLPVVGWLDDLGLLSMAIAAVMGSAPATEKKETAAADEKKAISE